MAFNVISYDVLTLFGYNIIQVLHFKGSNSGQLCRCPIFLWFVGLKQIYCRSEKLSQIVYSLNGMNGFNWRLPWLGVERNGKMYNIITERLAPGGPFY